MPTMKSKDGRRCVARSGLGRQCNWQTMRQDFVANQDEQERGTAAGALDEAGAIETAAEGQCVQTNAKERGQDTKTHRDRQKGSQVDRRADIKCFMFLKPGEHLSGKDMAHQQDMLRANDSFLVHHLQMAGNFCDQCPGSNCHKHQYCSHCSFWQFCNFSIIVMHSNRHVSVLYKL